MLKNTEGIVLKTSVFAEADLIVTYLCKDYGIIQTYAKSPRKIKSRFGSSLEPLTYSKIAFLGKEQASLPRLTRSDIIKSFHTIREDAKTFMDISEILRLNLNFIHKGAPVNELFYLLYHTLQQIDDGADRELILLMYRLKFLGLLGYSPNLQRCGKCGVMIPENSSSSCHDFFINDGTILCNNCKDVSDGHIKITQGGIRFYNSLMRLSISKAKNIKAHKGLVNEMLSVINSHIRNLKHR
ncbi:MAG: DNA repair protein RecO [Thermodesulfovibrionales bacterium]|nr:DNA repair protein RecO [Thermodesulfovibrionales bacterium]